MPTWRAAEREIEELKKAWGKRRMQTDEEVRCEPAVEPMKDGACGEALPVPRWTHGPHGPWHGTMAVADP